MLREPIRDDKALRAFTPPRPEWTMRSTCYQIMVRAVALDGGCPAGAGAFGGGM